MSLVISTKTIPKFKTNPLLIQPLLLLLPNEKLELILKKQIPKFPFLQECMKQQGIDQLIYFRNYIQKERTWDEWKEMNSKVVTSLYSNDSIQNSSIIYQLLLESKAKMILDHKQELSVQEAKHLIKQLSNLHLIFRIQLKLVEYGVDFPILTTFRSYQKSGMIPSLECYQEMIKVVDFTEAMEVIHDMKDSGINPDLIIIDVIKHIKNVSDWKQLSLFISPSHQGIMKMMKKAFELHEFQLAFSFLQEWKWNGFQPSSLFYQELISSSSLYEPSSLFILYDYIYTIKREMPIDSMVDGLVDCIFTCKEYQVIFEFLGTYSISKQKLLQLQKGKDPAFQACINKYL